MTEPGPAVYPKGDKWCAEIRHPNGFMFIIGENFPTREAAKEAYVAHRLKFYPAGPTEPVVVDPAKHHDLTASSMTAPTPKASKI